MDHVRFPLVPFVLADRDRSRGTSAVDCASSTGFPTPPPRLRDTPARVARLLPTGAVRLDYVGCHASCAMRATICRNRGRVK
jgi:hypothetical protein